MAEIPTQTQPQVTTPPKSTNWKKVILTIVFIVGVVAVVSGIYWFMVVNKSSGDSDLTGPVPKVTTKTSTESAKEATPSVEKDETADWITYTSEKWGWSLKHPKDWSIVVGGPKCALAGGGPGNKDTICFFSPDFSAEKLIGFAFQVKTRSHNPQKTTNCFSLPEDECQELMIAGQKARKLTSSFVEEGKLLVDDVYNFADKNNKSDITITFSYTKCQSVSESNCTKKEDLDSFSSLLFSTFKFLE